MSQATSGELTVSLDGTPRIQTQFLTSTFGGYLPPDLVLLDLLTLTRQLDHTDETACTPLSPAIVDHINQIQVAAMKSIGLLVRRGGCRFDQKAVNLLSLTDALLIVYDANDEPLQRLGGLHPTDGYLSTPAIMIPFRTAELIQSALATTGTSPPVVSASLFSSPSPIGSSSSSSSQWIDIALAEWEESDENKLLQIEGFKMKYASASSSLSGLERDDLMAWLERKRKTIDHSAAAAGVASGRRGEEL
jgi:hypothetical protein